MATEQTITISGTPTVVSGVTVPYVNTSDLEIYIGKGLVEKVVLNNAGAGYTTPVAPVDIEFSGGGGSSAALKVDVSNGQAVLADAGVPSNKGSGYTTSPIVGFGNLTGGTGASATAEIFVKKAETTDYSISGKSGFSTITFTSALANLDKVLIKRVTDVTTAANVFTAGSAITAEDLNKSFDQLRHKAEELPNVTSTALTDGDKGEINVSGSQWTIDNNAITTVKIADDAVTSAKLDTNIDIAGTLDVTGIATFDSDIKLKGAAKKLQLSGSSGSPVKFEVVSDSGTLAINTDKFTANGETGNVTIAGTLDVTGATTLTGLLDANGGASIDNIQIGVTENNKIDTSSGNLTIASAGGTTNIDDTFQVAETKLVVNSSNGNTDVLGDFRVNTNKVEIAAATGNTTIAGTLAVSGNTSVAAGKSLTANGPLILGITTKDVAGLSTLALHATDNTGNNIINAPILRLHSSSGEPTINTITGGVTGQIIHFIFFGPHDIDLGNSDYMYDVADGSGGGTEDSFVAGWGPDSADGDTATYIYDSKQWIRMAPASEGN